MFKYIAGKMGVTSVVCAGLLFSASAAMSGTKTNHPVEIDLTQTPPLVTGSFGSARNTADGRQLIRINDRGNSIRVVARDAAGNQLACITNNSQDMAALRVMSDSSFVRYFVDNNTCTNVIVRNGSQYRPK